MKNIFTILILVAFATLSLTVEAQVDTSGIGSWKQMYNSTASWEEGAFAAHALGHPDRPRGLEQGTGTLGRPVFQL